jgi:hypothetical protein
LLSASPSPRETQRKPALPETRFARVALSTLMVALPLAALAYGWLAPDAIDTDGAVVRMQGISGPFRVTVFTEPGAVQPGSAGVSVLVQNDASGETILDAGVDLVVQSASSGAKSESIRATHNQSTNKLLAAATVNLPAHGPCDLRVFVRRKSDQGALTARLDLDESQGSKIAHADSVTPTHD